jgi:hypothetical protein
MPSNDLKQGDSRVIFEDHVLNNIPEAKTANALITRKLLWDELGEQIPGKINFIDVDTFVRLLEESGRVKVVSESGKEVNLENESEETFSLLHVQILEAFRIYFNDADIEQINDILRNLSRIKLFVRGERVDVKLLLKKSSLTTEKPQDLK